MIQRVLCIPPANCAKRKLQTAKQVLYSITMRAVGHKVNANAVAGVRTLKFPVVNKSVTAEV